jgi:hypothetical protein
MPASKESLIARKTNIQRQILQAQRELERERLNGTKASKRIALLERKIEQLMAEQQSVRLEIDKAAPADSTPEEVKGEGEQTR